MEDTLGECYKQLSNVYNSVLILILMEDTLGDCVTNKKIVVPWS